MGILFQTAPVAVVSANSGRILSSPTTGETDAFGLRNLRMDFLSFQSNVPELSQVAVVDEGGRILVPAVAQSHPDLQSISLRDGAQEVVVTETGQPNILRNVTLHFPGGVNTRFDKFPFSIAA